MANAIYKISIKNSTSGDTQERAIGAYTENILLEQGNANTLKEKLTGLDTSISNLQRKASTSNDGLMTKEQVAQLNSALTTIPTATTTTLGGVKIGTGIGISNGVINNAGVRSIASGSAAGTISVNTNGTSANVKVNGWDSISWVAGYTANSFAPANYSPTAASIQVGSLAAGMKVINSATLTGMLRNIEYTATDPGAGAANSNNGLLICVYE